ncbi:dTDP-glucose 4,6-dehydratase [Clostridium sp. BSD9I1]|uniref:dTDP-glucose 4,6-dehydratase n=1 Tax=Clostridium sp. BSD9I1 TaxID=2003589 RepID=UPI001645275D|nr:SDR family NAD(P)-dependent oxidoreductase [Clostridium sp. BSD9I1]
MNILVTGGAGFIGRWVVKKLLEDNHKVAALDNLSNGSLKNIEEFINDDNFTFVQGDIKDNVLLKNLFKENKFDIIYHLAASIIVQDSIDDPETTFYNDTIGTFNILERARMQMFGESAKMQGDKWICDNAEGTHPCKVVFMSTCMVYDKAGEEGIDEFHPTKPISPYGASKIAAENLVLSYYYTYKLPTVVIRPFNTYGPLQKTNGEGGVIAIFINKALKGEELNIYGTGKQTRDLLYVKDCARFVIMSGFNGRVNGEIVNAGTGRDVTINELASVISRGRSSIKHVDHIHPQSEIMKLKCNYAKAKEIAGWEPEYSLEEGINETEEWIKGCLN